MAKQKQNKRDIYQEITDHIVAELEKGVLPWLKPWDDGGGGAAAGLPVNYKTGRPYHGINVFMLWSAAARKGYTSNRWMTFKQAQDEGACVRKGEKSTPCIFFKVIEKEEQDSEGNTVTDQVPIARAFNLFNEQQVDGLPLEEAPAEELEASEDGRMEVPEAVIEATGARIVHGTTEAYYSPGSDLIRLPNWERFIGGNHYYATALHELVHWTGHPARLDRLRTGGDEGSYAFEELIAEMGAAFLCAQTGVRGDLRHEGYIASWLKALRDDKRAVVRAASQARKASEYILACQQQDDGQTDESAA